MVAPQTKVALGATIGLGLLAAFFYAAQHPFQKPLMDSLSRGADTVAVGVIAGEIAGLLVAAMLCLNSKLRLAIFRVLFSFKNLLPLLLLAVIKTTSLVAYLVLLREFNAVRFAIILNLFPFWTLMIQSLLSRRRPPALPTFLFLGVAIALIVPSYQADDVTFAIAVGEVLLGSIVPILFATSQLLERQFFKDVPVAAYTAATTVFDAPIFLGLGFWTLSLGGETFLPTIGQSPTSAVLFVVGAFLSGYLAHYTLQKGLKAAAGEAELATVWFFLIPTFVGVTAAIMRGFGIDMDASFNDTNIPGLTALAVAIIVYAVWARHERKKKAN